MNFPDNFADILLISCVRQMGIVILFLLFEQYGVKILITIFWDTQYSRV